MPSRVEGAITRSPRLAAVSPDWTTWDRVSSQHSVPESASGRAPPRKARLREAAVTSMLRVHFLLPIGDVREVIFKHGSIGTHFERGAEPGPSLVVSKVVPEGQGLTYGVQRGWLVVTVNGEDVRRLPADQVLRMLQRGGAQLEDIVLEETRAERANTVKQTTNLRPGVLRQSSQGSAQQMGAFSRTHSERIQKPPPLLMPQLQAGPLPSLVALPISQYVSAASMKEVLASLPDKPDPSG